MLLRKCTHCGLEAHTEMELKKFKIAKRSKYGRENRCRKCADKQYPQSPEKKKAYSKTYSRKWRKKNPDYMKEWFRKNPNYMKEWNRKNPEYTKEYLREWRKKNPNRSSERLKNQFNFKGKPIFSDKNPRSNICSECGKSYPKDLIRQTNLHHIIYDENDPLAFTVELCVSCHVKLHWKLRRG